MAQHEPGEDHEITVYSVVGLGQVDIGIKGQFVRANSLEEAASVIDVAALVNVEKLLVDDPVHRVGIVGADRLYPKPLDGADGLEGQGFAVAEGHMLLRWIADAARRWGLLEDSGSQQPFDRQQ